MKASISLCTIPPRYTHLDAVLEALLRQSHVPHRIFVTVPRVFVRFEAPEAHVQDLQERLARFGERVILRVLDEDFGANTKFIAAMEAWEGGGAGRERCLILCDDDIVYHHDMIGDYVAGLARGDDRALTHFDARDRLRIPGQPVLHLQGADSYCLPASFFEKYSVEEYRRYVVFCLNLCPQAFFQDDYLVSLFLHLKDVGVRSLAPLGLRAAHWRDQMHRDPRVAEREGKTVAFLRNHYSVLKVLFGSAAPRDRVMTSAAGSVA